jgi:Protein of unknown function (DUF4230)
MNALFSWKSVLAAAAAAIVLVLVGYGIVRHAMSDSTEAVQTLASQAAQSVKDALNITPRVTVNSLTVIQQSSPILELAVIQQPVFKEYSWSHTSLGSTKTLVLRGEFLVKAGFNLQEPFVLRVENSTTPAQVYARLPKARILSIEMKQYRVSKDESGFWNFITPKDREQAVAALQNEARASVETSGLLEQAEYDSQSRIQKAFEKIFTTHAPQQQPLLRFEPPALK